MAKTYDQIQSQIRKLQQAADALKAKEIAGVVARMQHAIAHYGLTPDDVFGKPAVAGARKPASKRVAKATNAVKTVKAAKPAKATKPAKAAAPTKYQDAAGNRWSGIGKRPNWFKAALAAGTTPDDLRVRPAA